MNRLVQFQAVGLINGESEVINKVILEDGIAQTAFHGACTLFRTKRCPVLNSKKQNYEPRWFIYMVKN